MKPSHNYDHSHYHSSNGTNKKIVGVFFLNVIIAIVELIAGVVSGSTTLISNFLHDFGDSVVMLLTYFFEKKSLKQRDDIYTYGYRRFSVLGAFINLFVLFVGSILIINFAVHTLFIEKIINEKIVIFISIVGLIVNLIAYIMFKNKKGITEEKIALNFKIDIISLLIILIANIVIWITKIYMIDSLLSIVFGIWILKEVFTNFKEIFYILMQAKPDDVDIEKVMDYLLSIDIIEDIHDLHIWSLDGEDYILSMHLVVSDSTTQEETLVLKENVKIGLEKFGLNHSTIETESMEHYKKTDFS